MSASTALRKSASPAAAASVVTPSLPGVDLAHALTCSSEGTTTATSTECSESPCTNTCATKGDLRYTFSIFSAATYSP
jgi:hypothetical protein